MSTFNEDTRVKIPATVHFLRLGYEYQKLKEGVVDFDTKIFINRFKPALERINNEKLTDADITAELQEIDTLIKNNDLGKEFYNSLIDPKGRKIIDLDNIDNNDFAIVDELPFSIQEGTEEGSFRPDINILINGIPLAFLEVKKPNNEGGIQKEFERMINKRLKKDEYRKYFNLIQLVTFSNNMEYENDDSVNAEEVKAGSFYTTPNGENTSFSFFREDDSSYHKNYPYKNINEETIRDVIKSEGYNPDEYDAPEFQTNLSIDTPCNKFITSFFDKERLIYFIKYGLMYLTTIETKYKENGEVDEKIPVPQKHVMRYPQFFATRKIIERLDKGARGGVIWHTQGSGKTALAAFSNRIIRDYYSKKGISARFFFIVDRLDLMTQASQEFAARNINVINCDNKAELARELVKPLEGNKDGTIANICVVNIQRIDPDQMPVVSNDYDVKVQRVFFVDEAHRSYAKGNGEFYKNLMTCDDNGVYIAMTGTPLLNKKERSDLRFGDYIHKYFYDKSIADGYTLRIKKEEIETVAKTELRANLDVENQNLENNDVYESNDFVSCVSKYIEKDFKYFRLENTDDTIGGMIVCRTNLQAKLIHDWFEKNSDLKTGLVISDSEEPKQAAINKTNQEDFKYSYVPDILVVHYMLTTGYDVSRLKKMYLLRAPRAHSLLQTISRVNRPYKNKKLGKTYKYGYIVDFVDIEEAFQSSLQAYIKELEDDEANGDEDFTITGLIIDKEDIQKKFLKLMEDISNYPVDMEDAEKFSGSLTMLNKDTLLKIRQILNEIRDCRTEFELSKAKDYAEQINKEKIMKMLKVLQLRINLINLREKSIDTLAIMNNKEVMEIIYEFFRVKTYILDLSQFDNTKPEVVELQKAIEHLQEEIKNNKNKNDIKVRNLEELLKKLFDRLSIDNIAEVTEEIKEAAKQAEEINNENRRLAEMYGGHYSFVKTYSESINNYSADKSVIEKVLLLAYVCLKDNLKGDAITIQGKSNFTKSVKNQITTDLFNQGLYSQSKDCLTELLNDLYVNIQLFM